METTALGIAAPVGSVTVPVIRPNMSWAAADPADIMNSSAAKKMLRILALNIDPARIMTTSLTFFEF
jgi:hypothetical protein